MTGRFSPIPENFEPTRATLHQYAKALGVVAGANAEPHEKWWHIALSISDRGLETTEMALPDGGRFNVRLDLESHQVVVSVDGGDRASIDMRTGLTGTEMGAALLAAVAELGVSGEYNRAKFESDEAGQYDPDVAAAFHRIIRNLRDIYATHRARLGDSVSPLHLWPHGFDMAFEWFGTRIEEYEENGVMQRLPAQCNFGFYPGGRAYLYANPWPFDGAALIGVELPSGAEWHTEEWQGSILYYDLLIGEDSPGERVLDYLHAVFAAAAPTLSA